MSVISLTGNNEKAPGFTLHLSQTFPDMMNQLHTAKCCWFSNIGLFHIKPFKIRLQSSFPWMIIKQFFPHFDALLFALQILFASSLFSHELWSHCALNQHQHNSNIGILIIIWWNVVLRGSWPSSVFFSTFLLCLV